MARYKKKQVYISPGAPVVWKKNKRTGKLEPTIVGRRGYVKVIKLKV